MRYRPGDIFTTPEPTHPDCRFRVRDIEQEPHWDSPQYSLQLYTLINSKTGEFAWHNRDHDRHFTAERMEEIGLVLVERGKPVETQLELFT
jgi:hypothetical protein